MQIHVLSCGCINRLELVLLPINVFTFKYYFYLNIYCITLLYLFDLFQIICK